MPRYGISSLARDPAGEDLALPAARAEAAGDEHAVDVARAPRGLFERHLLGVDPAHAHAAARGACPRASAPRGPRGTRRGASRTCRRARSRPSRSRSAIRSVEVEPLAEVGRRRVEPELRADELVEPLVLQLGRDEVDVGHVGVRDHRVDVDVGEEGDLLADVALRAPPCERQTTTSGWIPMRRSSLTECCVGFVFSSPAVSMNGTRVTWR